MVKIRLARFGKKKQPTYRLIISDSRKDTLGTFIESVGFYDPRAKKSDLKTERIKYWISKGAQPSSTVHNLLVENKVIEGKKVKVSNMSKKAKEALKNKQTKITEEKPAAAEKEAIKEEKSESAPAEAK